MLKKCIYCGKDFDAKNGNQKLCPDCKAAKKGKKLKAEKPISVLEMSRIIEAHNRKYGTSYTYGEFEKLISQKKIFILDGESFEKRWKD